MICGLMGAICIKGIKIVAITECAPEPVSATTSYIISNPVSGRDPSRETS